MEISFTSPEYLRLFIVIPIIIAFHFFSINYKKRRAVKFANFKAIERVTGSELISKNIVLLILNLFIASILIFSAAGMGVRYKEPVSSYNFVIGIDSSESMGADDFSPNRLEAAKSTAKEFVGRLPSTTNIGVISFAGSGFIEQLPTRERDKVVNAIDSITMKEVGGTDVSEVVMTGTNLLYPLEDTRTKAIVLISDGQLNAGPSLKEVVDYAKKEDVVIYTMGIGTEEGGEMEEGGISKLDEETLKALAYNTNGKYYRANSSEALDEAYRSIMKPKILEVPHPLSGFLVILAVFLLVVQWWLANMRYGSLP